VRLIKKIVLISGIILACVVMVISGMGMYLYYHPERVKPVIERSIAAATGLSCTIESVSLDLQPMAVEARGIFLKSLMPKQTSTMEIPFIRTDMATIGRWGRKSLILKNMRITGVSFSGAWPGNLPAKKDSSFLAAMVQRFVGFFLFRDVRFQSGEILDGEITGIWGDLTIAARQIQAASTGDNPLILSFAVEIKNDARQLLVIAPKVSINSSNAFDILDFKFTGALTANGISLRSAEAGIKKMDVASMVTYQSAQKNLLVENLKIHCKELFLMEKSEQSLPPLDVSLMAEKIAMDYPVIKITNMDLKIPQVKIPAKNRDIKTGEISLHLSEGIMDLNKKTAALPDMPCKALGLKNMFLGIHVNPDTPDDWITLVLQGKNAAIFQAAEAYSLISKGWKLSAKDTARIEIAGTHAGPWKLNATLTLVDMAYTSPDESQMGEKITLTTRTEGLVDFAASRMTVAATLNAGSGEALYDRYYVNLAKNPVAALCKGSYAYGQGALTLSSLNVDVKDILPLEIKGSFKQSSAKNAQSIQSADFTVTIPQTPLKPIVYHLLQEPFKTESPFLTGLETGGSISGQVTIKQNENARQVRGKILWRDGNLAVKERNIKLTGISLDLPVWYESEWAKMPGDRIKGKCAMKSVTLPMLPEQPFSILVDAGPNALSVDAPTVIQVPGGNVRLGAVQVNNLFSKDISAHTRLDLDGINMQTLLSGIGALPPEGKLSGTLTGMLDPVRYENHTLTAQGEIIARVFGGKIEVSNIKASGVFTAAPVLMLNAACHDLMLNDMTTDTTFGKIEGVLEGHIRNFEIAYGQPQKFDLLLETVKRKDVPQTISIKAVDNIAQIGGGQSPFMGLAGAFASVFERFPYKKIGIRAGLENDMFTINGTIHEDGTEYIVKRSGFSGVNIVNQNPDNRINFKDMMKRIQRITHKGGAVVQ
jgi:hypothetical protein